jgi:hypothetical protein
MLRLERVEPAAAIATLVVMTVGRCRAWYIATDRQSR